MSSSKLFAGRPRFGMLGARVRRIALAALALASVSFTVASAQAQKAATGQKKKAAAVTGKAETKQVALKTSFGEVTLEEFEAAFRRMNDKDPYGTTLDSLLEFLDVYSDYRLKLQEAKEMGMHEDPKILKEIQGYREMLAPPYLLEKELTEPAIKIFAERRKWESRASHFLAKHKSGAPADTLEAFNRAMTAIRRLKSGESMALVTMSSANNALIGNNDLSVLNSQNPTNPNKYTDNQNWVGSDDKQSAKNGGELGFFTGGMTVRPFEDALYALKPGEITEYPVRTQYGYHVIQLHERIPRVGGVKVQHIFLSGPSFAEDTAAAFHKADSVYKLLQSGADFGELARQVSDHKATAVDGGHEIINREERRIPDPALDRAIYNLKEGETSTVLRSPLGYHIFKRIGTVEAEPYEKETAKLKELYKRYYFEGDKAEKLKDYKKQFGFNVDSAAVDHFLSRIDTTRTSLDSAWTAKLTSDDRNRVIYTIKGRQWKLGAWVDSLNSTPGAPLSRKPLLEDLEKMSNDHVLQIATENIAEKYPEFETIMEDYKNGIVLFELEGQKVWTKAVPDTAGVRKFYEANRMKFLWPERVDVSEIFVLSDSVAKSIYKRLMAGEDFETLAKQYTERPGYKDKAGRWPLLQKEENEIAKRAFTFIPEEIKEPFRNQAGYSIVKLNRRVGASQKTFEEARQEAASQYQEARSQELRNSWIAELRKRFNRQPNKQLLTAEWKKHNAAKAAN